MDLNQFQRFCDSLKHQPAKRMRCSRDLNLQTLGFEDQQFNTSLKKSRLRRPTSNGPSQNGSPNKGPGTTNEWLETYQGWKPLKSMC